MKKQYKLSADQIQTLVTARGSCIASDRITVDGMRVGYMYREKSQDPSDSGWNFFSGDEPQDYVDDPRNLGMYNVNTIANYDPDIVPLLDKPFGTAWARDEKGEFVEDQINPIE
ncbi:DUF2185 domain-containing protein [Occallatibacter savannae]|uniref:DUF2185 domain-containing protein n=1 Tax=Occallatibacter savannae TaxID=1002691 RepID=UPI000D68D3F1|nr:DUF2185 domain-containing protein [Occallatibacter savannae]